MQVTPGEREELIRRVTRRVTGRVAGEGVVAGIVDRVIAALGDVQEPGADGEQVVVVTGESMPDLASRLRTAMDAGVTLRDLAVATEGRHTVCVARVDAAQVPMLRTATDRIGARLAVRDRG